MKLIAGLPRIAVLLGLLLLSFGGFAQAEQADEMWYRRKFSLQLKADQTFTTTDTSLTKIQEGTWKKESSALILLDSKNS